MAKIEHISVYNLNLEKAIIDLHKSLQASDNKQLATLKYSLFYPMIGKEYSEKKELIMYGQAESDWKPTFKLSGNKKLIEATVKKAYEYSTVSRGCALDWVNKYWIKQNLYRSFFWNITYKLVMERYGRTDKDWNHIIAYSNLLKIAPSNEDITPDIFQGQLYNSAHLLKEELSLLQPKNVVLVTGLKNWAEPILRAAGIKYTTYDSDVVQATGAYRGTHIIVTKRPFTADHRKFLDEIKRNMV